MSRKKQRTLSVVKGVIAKPDLYMLTEADALVPWSRKDLDLLMFVTRSAARRSACHTLWQY